MKQMTPYEFQRNERVLRQLEEKYLAPDEPDSDEGCCDFCGSTPDYYIGKGRYCCGKCLDRAALDGTRITNEDAVVEFLKTYSDEFHDFLEEWYS